MAGKTMKQRKRIQISYNNLSERYNITKHDCIRDTFHKQYHNYYRGRVQALRAQLVNSARFKFGSDVKIDQIADIKMDGNLHLIFGALLKRMKYRPSVLDEFADEENIDYNTKKNGYSLTDDEDLFELEDEQQILRIEGNINKREFVTGDVVGLYGRQVKNDLFMVEDYIIPDIAPQVPWPIIEQDSYVVFISGIQFSTLSRKTEKEQNEIHKTIYALEEFRKWINAEISLDEDELNILQNIDRIIIAGDSFRFFEEEFSRIKVSDFRDLETDKKAITEFDEFLESILYNIPIDIMSGPNDPSVCMVPQEPIPRIIFPRAQKFINLLSTVTNPYKFSLRDIHFLGTSGQNITDLMRSTDKKSTHELMERTIDFGHIFPTVPDTIDGFPFTDRDPLVFDEIPHVYFIGNQERFQHSVMKKKNGKKSVLISVPTFCKTRSIALFNMRTLEASEYVFLIENDLTFQLPDGN